jgi:hypothetical protein
MKATIAALLLLISVPVMAQQRQSPMRCIPAQMLVERAEGAVAEVRLLSAEATSRMLAWFNALPPVSEHTFDTMVVMVENGGRLSLFFGSNGLVCGGMQVPEQHHQSFMRALFDGWPA